MLLYDHQLEMFENNDVFFFPVALRTSGRKTAPD
jgi:hypothetical protein